MTTTNGTVFTPNFPGDMITFFGEKGFAITNPVPHPDRNLPPNGRFATEIPNGTRVMLVDGKLVRLYHTKPGETPCHTTPVKLGESFYIISPQDTTES